MIEEEKFYDFSKMTEFPDGWSRYLGNVTYAFSENGVTINPDTLDPKYMGVGNISVIGKDVVEFRRYSAFVSTFYLGWQAQGQNVTWGVFGLKIDGATGELIAQAGQQTQASGIFYTLADIEAIYVKRPGAAELKIVIIKTDGSYNAHTLTMPSTTATVDENRAGFLVYVTAGNPVTLSHVILYPPNWEEILTWDFRKLTAWPPGWGYQTNNTTLSFGEEAGLVIESTGTGDHWASVDYIRARHLWAKDKQVIKLVFATPPVNHFFLGWHAQGTGIATVGFGIFFHEATGELWAHAGNKDWKTGITYTLSEIKALYVQRSSTERIIIAVEKMDGTLKKHVLYLPDTTYAINGEFVGFYVYVNEPPSHTIVESLTLSSRNLESHFAVDPKQFLFNLLSDYWNEYVVGFTPKFSIDWYEREEQMPQVVIKNLITPVGFTELGHRHQKFEAEYTVDVWSKGSNPKRWKMIEEIDRILNEHLTGSNDRDIKLVWISSWRDLDETDVTPKLYRSQLRVRLRYYKARV